MGTKLLLPLLAGLASAGLVGQAAEWRGLVVAEESRCSRYERGDYQYADSYEERQALEDRIVERMGGRIYGPYEGRDFRSVRQTDIEHIVAISEAHDSGLCAASPRVKGQFARDLLNLTLASPQVNRDLKGAKDASSWMPALNRCWFASRVVEVRRKYGLTIDRSEAAALESVLNGCDHFEMVFEGPPEDPLRLYDDNRNGRISCAEARGHGIAPVDRGHPAYPYMTDGDGDGVVCE